MTCPSCGAVNDEQAEVCFTCKAPLLALGQGDVLAGRWEIVGFLGRGGMGAVYRARDRTLSDEVALKVIRPDLVGTAEARERFTSEIKLARRVSHPGVCRIHEYGEDGRQRFFTMELVEGRSLRDVVRDDGPLPAERACALAAEMADALQAIHAAGIVHRDLKPLNVMVDREGRVRLMDFGIAKGLSSGGATGAGYVVGSPEYMSPEQARGRPVDARSDVYALGVVLYELLTGTVPFRGPDPVSTLLMHVEDEPDLGRFEEPVRGVLERALAKDPDRRFRTASGLAQALRRTVPAEAATHPLPAVGGHKRWMIAAGVAVTLALIVAIERLRTEPGADVAPAVPTMMAVSPPPESPAPSPVPTTTLRAALVVPAATLASTPPIETPLPTSPPPIEGSPPPTEPSPTPVPTATEAAIALPADVPAPQPTPPPTTVPAMGRLVVAVTPWAEVSIDGRHVGQTPLDAIPLSPGRYTVVLTHPRFGAFSRVVPIRPGETYRLLFDFTRDAPQR